MKKLVVLSAILAISAVSNAGLSLVDLGGGQMGIEGPAGANFTWYLGISPQLAASDLALTENVKSSLSGLTYYGQMDWAAVGQPSVGVADTWAVAIASTPTDSAIAGVQVRGLTNAPAFGSVDMGLGGIFLLNPDSGEMTSLFATPEPVSMVLLGLGGLFLRRRK